MKMILKSNLLGFILIININCNDLSEILKSQKNKINIYEDSKKTEKMGYGDWYFETDGELLMIKNFIKENDIVIDAGAHFGDWSDLVLKHTKNKCKLYAFEPVPNFFIKLQNKVNSNGKCYNLAIGKNDAEVTMNYFYKESEGCSSLYDRKALNNIPVQKINIKVTCLDNFCLNNQIEHINFLKIDVEGAEWDVLQGADKLISNKKIDFIQFEYGGTFPDANITLKQIYDYLAIKGYEIFRIAPDGLIHISKWRNELENNHLSNWLAIIKS